MCALISIGERGRIKRPDKRYNPHKIERLEPFKPVEDKQYGLIKNYSNMGFNWHSVLRLKRWENYAENITKVYSQKMSQNYVDRIMDSLVKRRSIDIAIAFIEQDDYLNNHLHFAWKTPLELTREMVAKQMRTNVRYLRDIRPIEGIEDAIGYFTKRIDRTGSYHNLYFN
jgi:hypothetical protein